VRHLEKLVQRLERQLVAAQDTKSIVAEMGEKLMGRLEDYTPRDTGHMASAFLKSQGPRWLPLGEDYPSGAMVFSVGNMRQVGNPGRSPRGTIKAFLRDHPEFRNSGNKFMQGKPGVISPWFKANSFRPSQAWWRLSRKAKQLLQQERLAGKYGGGYQGIGTSRAAYLYPQSGDRPEWQDSADAADITPSHFIEAALVDWRQQDAPAALRRYAQQVLRA